MAEIREEVIVDVKIDKADTEKQVTTLTQKITQLKEENSELLKTNKDLEKSGQSNSKQYVENAKQIEINKQKIGENTASRKSLITTIIAEDNSIKSLQVRNRELIKQRNEISTATSEGRAQIALLNKEIDENNETIRANSSSMEKQKMNIGNYASALDNLKPGLGSSIMQHKEMFASLTAGGAILGGVTAAIGLGIAAYAKSSRGARDMAKAHDVLASAIEIVSENFGEWIGTLSGQDSKGGMGLLEAFATQFLMRLNTGLGISSMLKAQAKDVMRELEISARFAQQFFKNDERNAELQRRIRDDTTKSMQERLAAAEKVEKFMQNAGDRTIVVLQAQIQAVKDSTTNFSQNREAQLKVAELEAEIADKREEITGKLTENAMAVMALKKEYEQLQITLADEAREARLEKYQEYLDQEHALWLAAQEKRNEALAQEEEIYKRFNSRLAKETKDRLKKETEDEKKAAKTSEEIDKLKNEALIGGLNMVTKERSSARAIGNAILKKDAIKETTINTYDAAVAAYKSLAGIPVVGPVLGAVAAAAVTAFGFAQIAAITGVGFANGGLVGFAEGGLSGTKIMNHHGTPINRSNGDNRLATVRTGEVILNERQQAALGGDDTFRRIGVPGFAEGGFTGFAQTAEASRRVDQAIDARNLAAMINQIKVVQVVQDFEVAQAAKNEPIIRAQVI